MKDYTLYSTFLFLFLVACNLSSPTVNDGVLEKTDKKIVIPIDSEIKIFTRAMHYYKDASGVEYITLENSENDFNYNSINFYRLDSCKLSHKVLIQRDGPNGIPSFMGHGVIDLNRIIINSMNSNIIYMVDRSGRIINQINYAISDDGKATTFFDGNSLVYKPLVIVGSKIYGVQHPLLKNIKGDDFKDVPLCITIDTSTRSVELLPMSFPRLWEKGEGIGFNTHCSRIYDGKQFVYAFRKQHTVVVTSDHIHSKEYLIKSKYIDKLYNEGYPTDISISEYQKRQDELAVYGNMIYDKYRNVYYRFAYPQCSVESTDYDYMYCRKEFSIIVVNSDFEVIGETYFKAGIYAPTLFFVNEDGLYISENNTDNPESSEDKLVFRCFKLV